MGPEQGFTMRFQFFTTELIVIMNSFMKTKRNKNQWIYQWICDIQIILKLSYINLPVIILFKFFEH